jgi:hypothetical protein
MAEAKMKGISYIIAFIIGLSFALALICAGYVGIEYHLGTIWGVIAVLLALSRIFTLPILLGVFFGAMNVWDWHWAWAGLFSASGLINFVIVPYSQLLADLPRRRRASP